MAPKRKILIVEDDEKVAKFIGTLLKGKDFEVEIAYAGKVALEKLKLHPDIVLLDRALPDMDGLEICRKIREDKRFRGIPIVILSARGGSEDKVEGLYVGADDYITKPFKAEELIARLEVVLRRIQFSDQMKKDKDSLLKELKNIIEKEQITPFFQPIFSLPTFKPLGFEVFGRPPQASPLNNPEFMFKLALSSGLYYELEMLCWRKAFEQWKTSAKPGKLFLNCNPNLIESGRFQRDLIEKQGVSACDIVLELTERITIQDYDAFYESVKEFRKMELGIAVDDVGCGFASLNTVAEVKPDYLKIDMSLIRSIEKDLLKQNIVQAIVFFSKKSGITTIAEGIETEQELEKVIELGIDAGQGFLLARPSKDIQTQSAVGL